MSRSKSSNPKNYFLMTFNNIKSDPIKIVIELDNRVINQYKDNDNSLDVITDYVNYIMSLSSVIDIIKTNLNLPDYNNNYPYTYKVVINDKLILSGRDTLSYRPNKTTEGKHVTDNSIKPSIIYDTV